MYLLDKGKEAEERFLLVDVNKEIERYEQGFPKNINDDEYKKIIDELEKTEKILNGGIK